MRSLKNAFRQVSSTTRPTRKPRLPGCGAAVAQREKSKLSWLPKALTEKRYTRCWHKTNAATRKPLGSSQDADGLVHTEPHEREMTGATRIWLQCAGRAFPLKSPARWSTRTTAIDLCNSTTEARNDAQQHKLTGNAKRSHH